MKFVFLLGFMGAVSRTVCNQDKTEYGYEGETLMLICPYQITVEKTTEWYGQPSYTKYFINAKKNLNIPRADRLSVEKNNNTNAYDLLISNFDKMMDKGNYSCSVNTEPLQQYFYYVDLRIDVHNVSLNPSEIIFTIREGAQRNISCEVNNDAVPAPNISWLIGSNLTSAVVTYKRSIVVTGKKEDNKKPLQCIASNNNKPPKTASTTLNVEYPPVVNTLSQHDIKEGENLSVMCTATPGNPNSPTFYWTKEDDTGFRQNGATLQLPNIQRTSSGAYRCTAENNYSNGEKGTHSQSMVVNVLYPPFVNTLSQQDIKKGENLSVTCTATPGNPGSTTFYWNKVDNSGFRQNGATLQLTNIQRNSSGAYRCTAENNYSNGEKGTHSQSMVVNVLYNSRISFISPSPVIAGGSMADNMAASNVKIGGYRFDRPISVRVT